MQCRVKGSLFNAQVLIGGLLDPLGDSIAVQRAGPGQDLEYEKVERSLETVILVFRHK